MVGKCYSVAGVCLGVALAAGSPESLAQTMFKCKDGGGRITYSNAACEKQGLKAAGAVADRSTTLSMPPLPSSPPRNRVPDPASAPAQASPSAQATAPNPPAAGDEFEGRKAPAQVKPVNPLIERLLR